MHMSLIITIKAHWQMKSCGGIHVQNIQKKAPVPLIFQKALKHRSLGKVTFMLLPLGKDQLRHTR